MRIPTCVLLLLLAISPTLALADVAVGSKPALPVWRVGLDGDLYPLSYLTPQGEPAGLAIDLIKVIAAQEGIEPTFKIEPWHRLRQALEQGRIDILPFMVYSGQRAQEVNFSVPYLRGRLALFRHKRAPEVGDVAALSARRIAVIKHSISHDYLRQQLPTAKLVLTDNSADLLARLDDGAADYAMRLVFEGDNRVVPTLSADFVANPLQQADLQHWVAIATTPHNDDLLLAVNRGLAAVIGNGEYDRLQARWSAELEPATIPFEHALNILWRVILGGAASLLLALLWSWSLKRQVRQRTQQWREESTRREQLQRRLQQGLKMEALGQLSSGIAHDFNNILTSILAYTELATERLGQPHDEKLAAYLQQVKQACVRASELINQLRLFSRSQSGELRRMQPRTMIDEVSLLLQASLPKTVVVEIDAGAQTPHIRVNPIKFHQILMNLCVNARDAMHGSGRIRISSRRLSTTDLRCSACGAAVTGPWVEIAIADNGSGIDPQLLPQIFTLGFSTKEADQGTGTGLSTVNQLLHEHHGHLVLHSPPALGSTFRLLFPEADSVDTESPLSSQSLLSLPSLPSQPAQPAQPAQPSPPSSHVLRGRHILIRDTDAAFRAFIGELLRGHGCVVTDRSAADTATGRGGPAGHEQAADRPPLDLVLLAGSLETPWTRAALTQQMASFAGQPVVLCTDNDTDRQPARWRPLGLAGVILKPVAPEDLIAHLAALLSARDRKRTVGSERPAPNGPPGHAVHRRATPHE